MSLSIAELVKLLPPPPPPTPALPTGVAALDAVLVGGGLPRGRLTEIIGPAGSGKTTLTRAIVESTVAAHGWVAYVDAQRTLDARDWVHLGDAEGVWIIRPRDAGRAAWCADVLLRSGAFALVVLDGAPALTKSAAVRLTRLAR
jgi:recombination protein RecA